MSRWSSNLEIVFITTNIGIINTSAIRPMIGFNHKPHMLMSTNGNATNINGINGTPPNMEGRVQPLNTESLMFTVPQ